MKEQLKYYYYQAVNTDWVRYLFWILATILLLVLLYNFFLSNNYVRLDTGRIYKTKEATQGVAIDRSHFYAIGNDRIGKYGRKSGQRVASKKFPFKHIKAGKIVNGDLVIVNTSPNHYEKNALIWLDASTLEIIDMIILPNMQGEITWFDWAWEKWWICDAQYKNNVKQTCIYCFSPDWVLEGYWKLPKDVLNKIEPRSLSGGSWIGEYLCVSDNTNPTVYVLDLPEKKIHAKLLRTVQVCFDGKGFEFERGKGTIYAWGIRNEDKTVVRCTFDLEGDKD